MANMLRKIYWFLLRPKTSGVKVVVINNNEVLLIKNSYGKSLWTLPGGGIHKSEIPENAATRELFEETGITANDIEKVTTIESNKEYKKDTVYCYKVLVSESTIPKLSKELLVAEWFEIKNLPKNTSEISKKIINLTP